jgi:transcriptional regulator with XRE-family HTH domain
MNDTEPVTQYQIKAARSLLGWTIRQLALRSTLSEHMVTTLEERQRVAEPDGKTEQSDAAASVRAALEAAGIEFMDGHASMARMRKPGR